MELLIYKVYEPIYTIVLKLGSVIDSVGVLGQWVNGRTPESLVEPHDWIGLNQITRLHDPVLRLNFYRYLIKLDWVEQDIFKKNIPIICRF